MLLIIVHQHQASALHGIRKKECPTVTRRSNLLFLLIRNHRLRWYDASWCDKFDLLRSRASSAMYSSLFLFWRRRRFTIGRGSSSGKYRKISLLKAFSLSLSLFSFIFILYFNHAWNAKGSFRLYKSLVVYLLMAYWYLSCSRHRHHVKVKDRVSKVILKKKKETFFFILFWPL